MENTEEAYVDSPPSTENNKFPLHEIDLSNKNNGSLECKPVNGGISEWGWWAELTEC